MIPRPSFYTLEDLQEPPERGGWGLTHDALMVLVEDGHLTTSLKTIRGEVREGITAEERQRAEGAARTESRGLRADAKRSRAEALAIVWAYAFGSDPVALKNFASETELEQFAARARIPVTRSYRTYADIYAEAIGVLVECGFLSRADVEQATRPSGGAEREAA